MTTEKPANSGEQPSPVLLQILALRKKAKENLRGVRRKIAVTGGKGGVGKSSITANLAAVLAMNGFRVGVLDADVQGASLSDMLGVPQANSGGPNGIGFQGIRVVSMGSILGERKLESGPGPLYRADAAWQSAMDAGIVREFIVESDWGELDFLFVDTPPASWEILSALSDLIPDMEGALIVTQPSEAARSMLGRSLSVCAGLNVPVLGIVENMAHWECPHCGQDVALFASADHDASTPLPANFLGSIPFDPRLGVIDNSGKPFAARHPDSPAGKALGELAVSLARLEKVKQTAMKNL